MAPDDNNIKISTNPSILPDVCDKNCLWLIDSAATSHICRNHDLFKKLHQVPPISIKTTSGKSFKANKREQYAFHYKTVRLQVFQTSP